MRAEPSCCRFSNNYVPSSPKESLGLENSPEPDLGRLFMYAVSLDSSKGNTRAPGVNRFSAMPKEPVPGRTD